MARQPRDDAPGVAHHVMVRGIERRAIFVDDADREDLLRRLAKLAVELGFLILGWALLWNHFHLVVQSANVRVSRLMARLGTGYVRRFNERHGRVGHLFQNRYRSRRAVDEADLMGLVLYAARNPLKHGLVADPAALEDFEWCGLGALLGRREPRPFEAVAETLALFGDDPHRARACIRERLVVPGPGGRVEPPRAAPTPRSKPVDSRFEDLLREVSARHAVASDALRARGRRLRVSAARRELVARAVAELGLSGSEISRRLGLTPGAVSRMLAAEHRPDFSTSQRTSPLPR
jgi:REP element-mobilizing transposase RayT